MRAMILAAGEGRRMRPLTDTTPKPLLQAGGKPLLQWHIERLKAAGIEEIVINIAHLGYQIPDYFGDGSHFGVHIAYSDEQEEGGLETLGGIVKALPLLGNAPFWVVNGDVYSDFAFERKELDAEVSAHLVLVPNPPHNPHGDFDIVGKRAVDSRRYTFSGIGLYHPSLFEGVAYGKAPLAPLLREAMHQGRVSAEVYEGVWYDIGTPERLAELDVYLRQNRL